MWQIRIDLHDDHRGRRYTILRDNVPITYAEALAGWRDDAGFRSYFIALLAGSPLEAYRWETPCVTAATLSREFEFVLLSCPALTRPVDPTTFAAHFDSGREVVSFPNLSGDAVLVVPCPRGDASLYGHLAAFTRHAPQSQLHALWQSVGVAMDHRVGERPVWLSTAGMGVAWLHVRLDDRPKYYGYAPFRQEAR